METEGTQFIDVGDGPTEVAAPQGEQGAQPDVSQQAQAVAAWQARYESDPQFREGADAAVQSLQQQWQQQAQLSQQVEGYAQQREANARFEALLTTVSDSDRQEVVASVQRGEYGSDPREFWINLKEDISWRQGRNRGSGKSRAPATGPKAEFAAAQQARNWVPSPEQYAKMTAEDRRKLTPAQIDAMTKRSNQQAAGQATRITGQKHTAPEPRGNVRNRRLAHDGKPFFGQWKK